MARSIRGTFLAPGISRNGRKYTRENIGSAVSGMKEQLAAGRPIPMHTSHMAHANGDTRSIAGHIVSVEQDEKGRGKFVGKLVDTAAGRDVAALVTPDADGQRALRNVSIFGRWVGKVTKEDGAETAPGLAIDGVDFTPHPGVADAQLEAATRAGLVVESFSPTEVFADMTKTKAKGKKAATERAKLAALAEGNPLLAAIVEAINGGADPSNLSEDAVVEAYSELSRRAHAATDRTFFGTGSESPFAASGGRLLPAEAAALSRMLESDASTEKLAELSLEELIGLIAG